jgi:hypothetical protein
MPEQSGGTRILQLIAAAIIATTATIGTLYVTSTSTYTEQGSDPVNPGNGKVALYAKTGKMYYMGSDGQSHEIGTSSAAGDTLPVIDTKAIVYNAADNTKQIKIDATTVVSGTAVLSSPPASTQLAGLSTTQTFTGTNTFAPTSDRGTQLTDNGSNFYQRWYSSASGGSNLYLYSGWPWSNTVAFTKDGTTGMLTFDTVNGRLGVNVNGADTAPLDQMSFGTPPSAGATRAMVNLTNTALNAGNANGTYIGANVNTASADFVCYQVSGSAKFKVDKDGKVYGSSFTGNLIGDLTGNVTGNCSGTSANVTGVVSVVNGGTGKNSVTAGSYLAGNGTGALVEKLPSDVKTDLALTKGDVGLGNVENTALSTWAGSANITTLGTVITGTWNGSTIAIANGGTGQTSKAAAFDALSPTTAKGDLIVHNGTNNVALTAGTDGYALVADSTQTSGIKWASVGGADPNAAHVNTANTFTTGIQEIQTSSEALKFSGAPAADATKALLTLGTSGLTKGNSTADGGTWLGIKIPPSGAGSAADAINIERGVSSLFRVTSNSVLVGDSRYSGTLTIRAEDHTYTPDTTFANSLTVRAGNETANSRVGGTLTLQSGSSAPTFRQGATILLKPGGPAGSDANIEITPGAVGADNSNACVFINKNAGNTTIGSNVASTAHSTCNVFGSFAVKVDAISSNIPVDNAYHVLPVNANGGAVTITLPDATTCKGREYIVKKIDASANTVTLDAYSTQTIDGALTQVISTQWSTRTVVSDGSNWIITNRF